MASPTSPTSNLPTRTTTMSTDGDPVPDEDTSEVTRLFLERLQAWKHACGYVEDYITATEKVHHSQGKEYEKVLKTVSNPLKESHHFAQDLGGISGMFDNIRSNTQGLSNSHTETAKTLKGSVLPTFERLHQEIKNKSKELTKGAGKGAKLVDKARGVTAKHIELLGQNTATFDAMGGKMSAEHDPYVIQRGVYHRLHKQVMEENNNRNDILAVQNSFAQFESHVLTTLQSGLGQFLQVVTAQAEQQKAMYGDIVGTAQRIPTDFEWTGFLQRNSSILIDPNGAPRTVNSINFPNQNHRSTQPIISGSLERKSKVLRKYETAYYVVTPSKFLHEFKTDDDFGKEPVPENSLYLPDCVVGAVAGQKFNVKGKDVSKGNIGNRFSMSHEFQFKAHTAADAQNWWEHIRSAAGQVTNEAPDESVVGSPTDTVASPTNGNAEKATQPAPLNTSTGASKDGVAVADSAPASAVPGSATTAPGSATVAPGTATTTSEKV